MIRRVIEERRRDLGGFQVGRVPPFTTHRMVGPFVFFDHIVPLDMPAGLPRSVDVRPHPHIGLSTVTYLFEGEITHRDSLGFEQPIRPGEVNWMTAGRGITHSERFERARREGSPMHGIQAWVGLPRELEEIDPAFDHYPAGSLPVDESGGLWVGGVRFEAGRMLVFDPGQPVTFTAIAPAIVMLLGGEPIGERFIEWNFVSSSLARIAQAKADWKAGRMTLPVHDDAEFIPLPAEPQPPPNPMS